MTEEETDPIEVFYSEYFMFSYSSLKKLLYSAVLFHNHYILKERRETTESYLIGGRVVHCLLLDKKTFDKNFIVMPGSLPGANNKKIVEHAYKLWKEEDGDFGSSYSLASFEVEILEWLVDNNLHQKLTDDKDLTKPDAKTADEKRMDKVLTSKSLQYFDYLKRSADKDVVDQETFDRCEEAVSILREHKEVIELLKLNHVMNCGELSHEVYNEKLLACSLPEYPFGLKGIVDNYVIDHVEEVVYITDLKTTGKTLREFKDSVEYYKYWMQAAIYLRLVQATHWEVGHYKFIFHFVVIDKYNQVYKFPVSDESMLDWQIQLDLSLEIAKYHYINKKYTLPYEFAIEQLTL